MGKQFMHRLVFFLIFLMSLFFNVNVVAMSNSTSSLASINFWHLNQALPFYQSAALQPWRMIPDYPVLKLGTKSYAVVILREHLLLLGDLPSGENEVSPRFDRQVKYAVQIFQTRHGLKADGVVGKLTRAMLNVHPEFRAHQIALNMKRWADLSSKLGDRFIIVNIPDFHMYLFDDNQNILTLRAIVGKPELPTPELSSKITRVVFNPYWNIPKKIAQNDIAPKVLEDPNYLYKMHIKVLSGDADDASQVNSYHVNWFAAEQGELNYQLRQDPGPDNALGLVKFEFQNSQSVYMHDTSAKNLFDTEIRDYSHGCIRLENPFALVEYLMKDDPEWNNEKMQEILDSKHTKYVKVPRPIPIFLAYLTAWVDENGRINFRDDLYQMDHETLSPTSEDQEGSTPWGTQEDGQLF